MNTEQKAKAYDEALEKMKSWARGEHPECFTEAQKTAEFIFPELKESEDERIKKTLIDYFQTYKEQEECGIKTFFGIPTDNIIAWLEKQGEQKEINLIEILKHYPRETELYSPLYGKLWLAKVDEKNEIITCYKYPLNKGCTRAILEQEETVSFYSNGTTGLPDFNISKDCMLFLYDIEKQGEKNPTDKVEPKFKVGDLIKHNKANIICKVISVNSGSYYVENIERSGGIELFNAEQNFHLWTIEDAKDGDVLFMDNGSANCIFIYKSFNNGIINKYGSYNNFGFEGEHYLVLNDGYAIPATKEQRELLFQKMKEDGYMWDYEKKELKKIENASDNESQKLGGVISELSKLEWLNG
jgi:hypothetical protein